MKDTGPTPKNGLNRKISQQDVTNFFPDRYILYAKYINLLLFLYTM